MRLVIKQCKYCYLSNRDCRYREKMKAAIVPVDIKATVVHKCPKYYETIPIGSHVEIELMEIDIQQDPEYQEAPQAEWISAGRATGMIIANSSFMIGFFVIRLDKSVYLVIPERDQGMHSAMEQLVEIRMKRGEDIKVLHRATPEETEAFHEKERQKIEAMLE